MHVFVAPFFLVLFTVATALLFCFVLHTLHKLYRWVATTCINTDVSPCLEDQRVMLCFFRGEIVGCGFDSCIFSLQLPSAIRIPEVSLLPQGIYTN